MRALVFLALFWALVPGAEAGFYRLKTSRGVWWLEDPSGKRTLSLGVNGVDPGVKMAAYDPGNPEYCALRYHPSIEKWRSVAGGRLKKWGFGMLGAGSGGEMAKTFPYFVALDLGHAAGMPYGDPSGAAARSKYREAVAPLAKLKNDEMLVGYFLDGQIGWWDEVVFLQTLKAASAKDPNKAKLAELLGRAYRKDVKRLNEELDLSPQPKKFEDIQGAFRRAGFRLGKRPLVVEEYLEWLAEEFYRSATEELRRVDSNHLVFSDRYGGYASQPVARSAGKYVDAIALNCDSLAPQGWASPFRLESLARVARKPILVSEFYFAATENRSGDRNSMGTFMTVGSQAERAAGASALATSLIRFPCVVGYHWFRWADQRPGEENRPATGEDFNMGLVDLKDGVYTELAGALGRANAEAETVHGSWPATAGMARSPQGLLMGRMPGLPVVDGSLSEWALGRAWVPGVMSAAPFERFGDLYLGWLPEGLAVAVAYEDYRARQRDADSPEADSERLTIGFGYDNDRPVVFTLKGIQERKDPDNAKSAFRAPEVLAVRGGVPFPAEGRFQVGQEVRGTQRVVEIFLPAALFRREKLEAGEILRGYVSLRMRANYKELFLPAPFRLAGFEDSSQWTPMVLEAAAGDGRTPPAAVKPRVKEEKPEAEPAVKPVEQNPLPVEAAPQVKEEKPAGETAVEPAGKNEAAVKPARKKAPTARKKR